MRSFEVYQSDVRYNVQEIVRCLIIAWLLLLPAVCRAQDNVNTPPLVQPNFLLPENSAVSDYRPVVDAEGATVVFERTFVKDPDTTTLYSLTLSTGVVRPLVTIASARADWCWNRLRRGDLTDGPLAFSNDEGVYRAAPDGSQPVLLPHTAGMIYPSWYPNCSHLAVDVTGTQVTAKIDASTGKIVASPLANEAVWAGFPSVNQADPNLVAFAGQFNIESNYYNQDLNYTWVTDRSQRPPRVAPMDRRAPRGPGFLQNFQARAGWWSPDGKWFAFESNRICSEEDGLTYAIFIQDASGVRPAMQVTGCTWNIQHPKWFPPAQAGGKTMLVAAVAEPGQNKPFRIASFDVSAFVAKR